MCSRFKSWEPQTRRSTDAECVHALKQNRDTIAYNNLIILIILHKQYYYYYYYCYYYYYYYYYILNSNN